ncbi:hypothetical protein NDU88_004271 [Pleurodeles waltl]|uniref:Centromere protein X n=1 Tax=Pleurodeles waltl TaxID=8319 RepID=A0AAV7NJ37_PLEWA|nr:hypothetical protein NDU88_004271 [Pleurodeles waltl]
MGLCWSRVKQRTSGEKRETRRAPVKSRALTAEICSRSARQGRRGEYCVGTASSPIAQVLLQGCVSVHQLVIQMSKKHLSRTIDPTDEEVAVASKESLLKSVFQE